MKKFLLVALVFSGCLNTRNENLSGRDQPLVRLDVAGLTHVTVAHVDMDVAPVQTRAPAARLY